MISCPSCGTSLKYDIATEKLKCEYCSQSYDPYIFDKKDSDAIPDDRFETRVWVCPGCGASIETTDENDITAVCSYCGGNRILFDRMKENEPPEAIIPFRLTKEDCKRAYRKAAYHAFLTPGRIRQAGTPESFRGIYMPYWSYEGDFLQIVTLPVKDRRSKRRGDYVDTKLYNLLTLADGSYRNNLHDASEQFDDNVSAGLAPYDETYEKPFTPGYLCGFYAESANVPKEENLSTIRGEISDGIRSHARKLIGLNRTWDEKSSNCYDGNIEVKPKLYPVWFMSARKDDKLTYAAVNGATGKVAADFPISIWKFILFALLLSGAVFAAMNGLRIMMMPKVSLAYSYYLSFVAWVVNVINSRKQLRRQGQYTFTNHNKLSDTAFYGRIILLSIGMLIFSVLIASLANSFRVFLFSAVLMAASVTHFCNNGTGRSEKFGFQLLFLSYVAVVLVYFYKPLNWVYWAVGFIISALFLVQVVFTVHTFNNLAYRTPPQFNKKGGDDNA